jgi:hypothetical protein
MTFQLLEDIRFFVGSKGRELRQAAYNCRHNGYLELALQHENEAKLADNILKGLANEHGEIYAGQKADNQSW